MRGISIAIPVIIVQLHVSALWIGLIGASSLLGIFLGAPAEGLG